MVYWVFFITSLFVGGYHYLLDTAKEYTISDVNSVVNYVDKTRLALAEWKNANPNVTTEVSFENLILPQGYTLKKRNDAKFYVDDNGIYITFDQPVRGAADALVKKYSAATNTGTAGWHLAYYHIGYSDQNHCLVTVRNYVEENNTAGICNRPLPAAITKGSLVITDADVK